MPIETEKKLEILIKGSVEEEQIILLNIIRRCLEQNHEFRITFEGYKISALIEKEEKNEQVQHNENRD